MKFILKDSLKLILILLIVTTISNKGLTQVQNYEKIGQEWKTNLNEHSIELNEIKALMKRDGIPPIDNPK